MENKKPLILVSNDDSLSATGIASLIKVAQKFGKVVVVAPEKPSSGKSHSVTMHKPVHCKLVREEQDLQVYTLSGTPADCVKFGIHSLLKTKPNLVISGINHGTNSSVSVVYSGTMAAAIEGCLNRVSSVGFSLTDYQQTADFRAAEKYAEMVIENVLKNGLPEGICLNVNIPKGAPETVKGMRVCRQAVGAWHEEYIRREHPYGYNYFWLTGKFFNYEPTATDTDEYWLNEGYVSVVPVKVDFTAEQMLTELKSANWNLEV